MKQSFVHQYVTRKRDDIGSLHNLQRYRSNAVSIEEIPLTALRGSSLDTSTDEEGSPRRSHASGSPSRGRGRLRGRAIPRVNLAYSPSPLASPARSSQRNGSTSRLVAHVLPLIPHEAALTYQDRVQRKN